jgi:hypothetical protein
LFLEVSSQAFIAGCRRGGGDCLEDSELREELLESEPRFARLPLENVSSRLEVLIEWRILQDSLSIGGESSEFIVAPTLLDRSKLRIIQSS